MAVSGTTHKRQNAEMCAAFLHSTAANNATGAALSREYSNTSIKSEASRRNASLNAAVSHPRKLEVEHADFVAEDRNSAGVARFWSDAVAPS